MNDRRGDIMLLINGMPLIHLELKKSGVSVMQAANQIEKYSREGVFSGLFSLVQIFVAMEPAEALYFANPGMDGKFNPDFYFHWANTNNEPINNWKEVAEKLLSIPMAHQLIGFYTVPDDSDGILKVMRSYQYYAASAISDRVANTKWGEKNQRGGYIWHTTGSGKTMTSFKSAQLIANSRDADKVIFLIDRIELGTQSLKEYKGFADDSDEVQATESTHELVAKLKSNDPAHTLIVTSIQKMSNIRKENGMNAADIKQMADKRIVFIVDEAHRSTFGDMLHDVKQNFPNAIFFGFTGTPIHIENQIKGSTTADVFGNELHRYSIADGIRDENVLGFDPYKVLTYRDKDVRKAVALDEAKAATEEEAIDDPHKSKIYYKFMNRDVVPMAGHVDKTGKYVKGIEDYLPKSQYTRDEHTEQVVADILDNWVMLSHAGKFHALFATSSIPEAIAYYRLFKTKKPELKITALFDPNIDNGDGATTAFKEAGLVEIITDYNARYNQTFELGTHARFKKDIAARLAHKAPHQRIKASEQIDLLIVVDQMLTGFDSKWINTLYMDKKLEYQNIIQAFSRTNRLFGHDKPFGTIRYYRMPHTMERNIAEAVKLYSGDKPIGLFVQKLQTNLETMNNLFARIKQVFVDAGVPDFTKNPSDKSACGKFAALFKEFNAVLEAARIQGFTWSKREYTFQSKPGAKKTIIKTVFDENDYLVFAQRYKELFAGGGGDGGSEDGEEIPYPLDGHLTEIDTGKIDADYMNSRFDKYLRALQAKEEVEQVKSDLHKTFALLTQEEQKYAGIFLRDIERGDVIVEDGKTLRDYITEYQARAKADQIHHAAVALGLDEAKLRDMMGLKLTEANINEYGRFDALKATVDMEKARTFFAAQQGADVSLFKALSLLDGFLRRFLLEGGFDIE